MLTMKLHTAEGGVYTLNITVEDGRLHITDQRGTDVVSLTQYGVLDVAEHTDGVGEDGEGITIRRSFVVFDNDTCRLAADPPVNFVDEEFHRMSAEIANNSR